MGPDDADYREGQGTHSLAMALSTTKNLHMDNRYSLNIFSSCLLILQGKPNHEQK